MAGPDVKVHDCLATRPNITDVGFSWYNCPRFSLQISLVVMTLVNNYRK